VNTFQSLKQQCAGIKAPLLLPGLTHPVTYSEWVNGPPLAIWNLRIPQIQREALLHDKADFLLQCGLHELLLTLLQRNEPYTWISSETV
jgi:hypothetical protein